MLKILQFVLLGAVVLHTGSMSAMENKAPNSPRKITNSPRNFKHPLSCSQEARQNDSGDFAVIKGLKDSLEVRKDQRGNTAGMYYPWPGGNPDCLNFRGSLAEQMKPWSPHQFWGV